MNVDLHLHTTLSDGSLSPSQLFAKLQQNEVRLFSLTDHDLLQPEDIISQFSFNPKKDFFVYIPGVEISVKSASNRSYHILLYFKPILVNPELCPIFLFKFLTLGAETDYQNLIPILNQTKMNRKNRLNQILAKYDLNESDFYKQYSFEGTKLIRKYLNANQIDIDEKTIKKQFEMETPFFNELKHIQCTMSLAHPGSYGYTKQQIEEDMDEFRTHPGFKAVETDRRIDLDEYCKKYSLKRTKGSDYHDKGQVGYPMKLANVVELLEMLFEQ
ncbi:Metal-dependent_phosphoesterase [Hexamita inflata]|uniref:Putative n=1 Tax=Hexamita inflata TaxID=28002 RepID=A0AA86Q299_9EUKA|nr:Metal-dependent phosphoesterase [Hexamita inflata]CAI9949973.1 Metal-dependent phosphoesterase [Hexamita inflata]